MLPDAPTVAELIAASMVSGRNARLQALAPYAALPSAEGVATAIALMAQARGEQRRYDEAAALAQAAVGIRPDAARGYAQLARALFEMYGSRGGRSSGISSSGGGGGGSGSDSDAAGEASWGLWSGLSRQERLFEATEERKRKKQREKAITACKHAVKLAPKDSATYLRLGRLLRPIPGRLQEAIESYNGCLRYDALNAEAREEQSVLVERMRELQSHRPQPWDVATNLVAGVVTLLALTHFFAR
jgi:tetratricopeptide (TPR) repeat protein